MSSPPAARLLPTAAEERRPRVRSSRRLAPQRARRAPINRTFIDAWEDERVAEAVKATGRTKLIIAGLWTEMCVAMPTIQALGEGYEVYFVTDASGGVTREAHDMAVRRMVQAGGVPVTWMAVGGELQRDWARQQTVPGLADVLAQHGGGSGIAFAWEMQLLATPAPQPMTAASGQAYLDRANQRRRSASPSACWPSTRSRTAGPRPARHAWGDSPTRRRKRRRRAATPRARRR
jgi:nicotinamidase-related amidase